MGNTYDFIGVDSPTMDRVIVGIVVVLLVGSSYFIRAYYLTTKTRPFSRISETSRVGNAPSNA